MDLQKEITEAIKEVGFVIEKTSKDGLCYNIKKVDRVHTKVYDEFGDYDEDEDEDEEDEDEEEEDETEEVYDLDKLFDDLNSSISDELHFEDDGDELELSEPPQLVDAEFEYEFNGVVEYVEKKNTWCLTGTLSCEQLRKHIPKTRFTVDRPVIILTDESKLDALKGAIKSLDNSIKAKALESHTNDSYYDWNM